MATQLKLMLVCMYAHCLKRFCFRKLHTYHNSRRSKLTSLDTEESYDFKIPYETVWENDEIFFIDLRWATITKAVRDFSTENSVACIHSISMQTSLSRLDWYGIANLLISFVLCWCTHRCTHTVKYVIYPDNDFVTRNFLMDRYRIQ